MDLRMAGRGLVPTGLLPCWPLFNPLSTCSTPIERVQLLSKAFQAPQVPSLISRAPLALLCAPTPWPAGMLASLGCLLPVVT